MEEKRGSEGKKVTGEREGGKTRKVGKLVGGRGRIREGWAKRCYGKGGDGIAGKGSDYWTRTTLILHLVAILEACGVILRVKMRQAKVPLGLSFLYI